MAEKDGSGAGTNNKKSDARRTSLRESMSGAFRKARMSFARSRGDRGATVQNLRGTTGADFEGHGLIHRGAETGCCGSCCGFLWGVNSLDPRYIVIKGPFCFVFVDQEDSSPQYAIKLHGMLAEMKLDNHPYGKRTLVLLRNGSLGEVQYEISFSEESEAQTFRDVVTEQASLAATEETRKHLGHAHLLHKRSSIKYAETIALSKEKNQPDQPVSQEDVMKHMGEMALVAGPTL